MTARIGVPDRVLRGPHLEPAAPETWTSANAAGLPIFPGLARFDEVSRGRIDHALRFTVSLSRRHFIYPARHYASSLTSRDLPAMGLRRRLKRSFGITRFGSQPRSSCAPSSATE